MTRLRGDKMISPRGPAGSRTQYGDVKAICCECGYSEEWRKLPSTPRRCPMCPSRAVMLERQPPGNGQPIVIDRPKPDGAAKDAAGVPKFVWSLMGREDA